MTEIEQMGRNISLRDWHFKDGDNVVTPDQGKGRGFTFIILKKDD